MSHAIELSQELNLPGSDVLAAGNEIMEAIEQRTPPYDAVWLSVNLRDLKIPFDAELRVPVRARVEREPGRWQCRIEIGAEEGSQLFPRFDGMLTVTPEEPGQSRLSLSGSYDTPLGLLGHAIDATLLSGVAEGSLEDFLGWLSRDIAERALKSEQSRLNQARNRHR